MKAKKLREKILKNPAVKKLFDATCDDGEEHNFKYSHKETYPIASTTTQNML